MNAAAEADKRRRYPGHRAAWPVLPLARETAGRLGQAAPRHLRWLARDQAQSFGDGPEAVAAAGTRTRRWGAEVSAPSLGSSAVRGEEAPATDARLAAELAG